MAIHVLNTAPPICQVGLSVGLTFGRRNRGGLPQSITALIDTGASRTAVAPGKILALGPQQVGQEIFLQPNGIRKFISTYDVRIGFEPNLGDASWPLKIRWFSAVVASVAPATPGVDVLIGQDLLAELILAWDGPRHRLLLTY